MQGLASLEAFAATAKHGGFAAAARALGTDPSSLGKAVARLESRLGVRLFHRTTRRLTLTDEGERLYGRCLRVLGELESMQDEAAGASAAPSGTLRIDAPIVIGRRFVVPCVAALSQSHPALRFDVRLSDAYADLVRDRVDVAIRIGTQPDSGLVARRIGWQRLLLVASPEYLRARGTPRAVADLGAHRHVLFRMPSSGRDRPQQFVVSGRPVEHVPDDGQRFNDGEAMARAAVAGMGLAQLPHYMVEDDLRAGRLVELLGEVRPAAMPIAAVTASSGVLPARVRVFVEAIAGVLSRAGAPAQARVRPVLPSRPRKASARAARPTSKRHTPR